MGEGAFDVAQRHGAARVRGGPARLHEGDGRRLVYVAGGKPALGEFADGGVEHTLQSSLTLGEQRRERKPRGPHWWSCRSPRRWTRRAFPRRQWRLGACTRLVHWVSLLTGCARRRAALPRSRPGITQVNLHASHARKPPDTARPPVDRQPVTRRARPRGDDFTRRYGGRRARTPTA
jgi:hypothetical protein